MELGGPRGRKHCGALLYAKWKLYISAMSGDHDPSANEGGNIFLVCITHLNFVFFSLSIKNYETKIPVVG